MPLSPLCAALEASLQFLMQTRSFLLLQEIYWHEWICIVPHDALYHSITLASFWAPLTIIMHSFIFLLSVCLPLRGKDCMCFAPHCPPSIYYNIRFVASSLLNICWTNIPNKLPLEGGSCPSWKILNMDQTYCWLRLRIKDSRLRHIFT